MHVMVLGAGLSGVTTAWYLTQAGLRVSLLDRQPGAGLETSFANGGQISISHPEPWANPGAPAQILRWLGRPDAPLMFRPSRDPAQWRWGLRFLLECLPARTHRNTAAIAALAVWSGQQLRALRAQLGLQYDQLGRGILHLFYTQAEYLKAHERARALRAFGIDARVLDRVQCLALEPALAARAGTLAGGIHAAGDESGDAHQFTRALAERLAAAGATLHWETELLGLEAAPGGDIAAAHVRRADGSSEVLRADAWVVCLGSYGARMLAPLGIRLPIYPVKGYSITAPVSNPALAPSVSLTDESRRIVCSRLGERLRVAGTAELNGFDTVVRPERIAAITDWVQAHFPGAIDAARAEPWAGLRPATPGNVPLIGRSARANLWLNTGHGTLGWTLACGSAAALAELMCKRRPGVDFPFLDAS
ncbi:D-amino acid dehydrogenase [Thauera sp.]|jgi:D-amino-acid dehydrogenase|uniref:D-amino acid dehydrogenase n=1 Tax=Thauera sp. TaxID=1905334 RepID=UPI0026209B56|nr:D-amino acid dehydrogenase [Thauera sp.]MCK6407642.1 D-amino acid dehydrogenase [Thauera sp.]